MVSFIGQIICVGSHWPNGGGMQVESSDFMKHDISALVEAVRKARAELESLRDPRRNATPSRAVERLTGVLESKELNTALANLQGQESPSIAPERSVDFRVPYPWRSH